MLLIKIHHIRKVDPKKNEISGFGTARSMTVFAFCQFCTTSSSKIRSWGQEACAGLRLSWHELVTSYTHSSNSSHANSASCVRLKVEVSFNPSTGQLRAWQNAPAKRKSSESVNSSRETWTHEAKTKPQHASETFNILLDLLQPSIDIHRLSFGLPDAKPPQCMHTSQDMLATPLKHAARKTAPQALLRSWELYRLISTLLRLSIYTVWYNIYYNNIYIYICNCEIIIHFSSNKFLCILDFVYPALDLLKTMKNISINQTLSISTLAKKIYPATMEEHPICNKDLHRVLFWKTCNRKKMHQLSYGIWRRILKGIFLSHTLEQLCRRVFVLRFAKIHFLNVSPSVQK